MQKITFVSQIRKFGFTSFVMGCHLWKALRTPVLGKKLKVIIKPKNTEDEFAVAILKNNVWHLTKEKPEDLPRLLLIFYKPVTFARLKSLANLSVKEIGKEWRSHASFFSAEERFIKISKQHIPKTLWMCIYLKLFLSWHWNIFSIVPAIRQKLASHQQDVSNPNNFLKYGVLS